MKDSVARFCERRGVRISRQRADDYRTIWGRMEHTFIAMGIVDEIITDGLQAWVWSPLLKQVLDVHWSNLRFVDNDRQYKPPTNKDKKPKKPRTSSKKVFVSEPDWEERLSKLMNL